MASRQKSSSSSKSSHSTVPDVVKIGVAAQANELIETVLKPKHIQSPPDNPQFNYIVDLYGKWYQRYFYFCATYCVPGPRPIADFVNPATYPELQKWFIHRARQSFGDPTEPADEEMGL
jgi:hypothetical protein